MDIHLVRVPQDVDVVNAMWKPAKWEQRPAFFQSMLTAMEMRRLDSQRTMWRGESMSVMLGVPKDWLVYGSQDWYGY